VRSSKRGREPDAGKTASMCPGPEEEAKKGTTMLMVETVIPQRGVMKEAGGPTSRVDYSKIGEKIIREGAFTVWQAARPGALSMRQ